MDNPDVDFERLSWLFEVASEVDHSRRAVVLSENCDDPAICRRVLVMLEGADLPEPEPGAGHQMPSQKRIGAYKLIKLIGTGGLGAVYEAERWLSGATQRVALKVLAPHAVDRHFVERFHRERHILASLEHPNIPRLLDAGLTENGQPFIAMEYVQGKHLDEHCDAHRLSIADRIRLFLDVCNAVAYAHRNLIVHLDLKPSNVLVSTDGQIKLLDFGTSKLLQLDNSTTTTLLATPAFASPEQLRNEPVTTACDIYSLGAVLAELLCGRSPAYRSVAAAYFDKALRESEPVPLITRITLDAPALRATTEARLRGLLQGDLATIVTKCLRPQPKERYASVDQLIEDLRRYLEGRSILARPQTAPYKLKKFVQRNRVMVTISALFLLTLAGVGSYAAWRQHRELIAGRRALQMQTFLYQLLKLANVNSSGQKDVTLKQFLELGTQTLPQYIKDPTDLRQARLALAESMYENNAFEDAKLPFLQVLAAAETAGDVNAEVESAAFAGDVDFQLGDVKNGEALTSKALSLASSGNVSPHARVWSEIFYALDRDNSGYRTDDNLHMLEHAAQESLQSNFGSYETARILNNVGEDYEIRGLLDRAEQTFHEALRFYGDSPAMLCDRSATQGDLGWVMGLRGDVAGGLPIVQQSYDGYAHCAGADSVGALSEQNVIADYLIKLGRAPEALTLMQSIMPIWRRVSNPNSDRFSEPLYYLTLAENKTGHYVDAERDAREMARIQEGRVSPTDRRMGVTEWMLAEALAGQGRWQESRPHAMKADEILTHSVTISPAAKQVNAQVRQLCLEIESNLSKK